MPEGDTVWLVARRLDDALAGDVLQRSDLRVPALATADLAGRRVLEVRPRGKHLLTRVEGGLTLHTHLRMDGMWHLYQFELANPASWELFAGTQPDPGAINGPTVTIDFDPTL